MLQQTQAQSVIPFYNKWMEKFPNIQSLQNAQIDEVLKSWEGLGYYSRCHNIYRAANNIKNIPKTYEELIVLPGVGDYTAKSILSIAFKKKYVGIDTNLKRVASRFLGIKNLTKSNLKRISTFLETNQPEESPGDYNEALMDLGSQVCLSSKAFCGSCPLSYGCKAAKSKNPLLYPIQIKRSKKIKVEAAVCCIYNKNKQILLQKRENTRLLSGLWEFPGGKIQNNETPAQAVIREIEEEVKIKIKNPKYCGIINHTYSTYMVKIHVFTALLDDQNRIHENKNLKWVFKKNMINFAMPKANHKIIKLLDL